MSEAAFDLDWLVSVDDHVLEPAHVWQRYVPAKYRDDAPRLVNDDTGEYWLYQGKKIYSSGLSAVAGKESKDFSPENLSYRDMRQGCYDPVARLADMDEAGILASLCFPTFPRFCGQTFYEGADKELGLVCVQAYNDWMVEEWCGSAPGRYIPLVLIPLWDPQAAAREIERCAARGVHAVAFSENPAPLGLPTIHDPGRYWDPVFAAAADNGVVVCMHVGSSSQIPKISDDAPFMANLAWGAVRTSGTMLAWLFSGVFQRFPSLKIALSEGNVGWIPYFLERAEQVVDKQRYWVQRGINLDVTPTGGAKVETGRAVNQEIDFDHFDVRQTFRDHIFGCFIDDIAGIRNIDLIGEDNVMIETDYPHSDSTWPHSIKMAHERLAHLPEPLQYKILRGNAERLYSFTCADPA